MYGKMIFKTSLNKKPMRYFKVDIVFNEFKFNPVSNPDKRGGVYISYPTKVKGGPKGYFGVQINKDGGSLIY